MPTWLGQWPGCRSSFSSGVPGRFGLASPGRRLGTEKPRLKIKGTCSAPPLQSASQACPSLLCLHNLTHSTPSCKQRSSGHAMLETLWLVPGSVRHVPRTWMSLQSTYG